ncbi:MAG: tetraacyldisaccharide 4'-kinase [bacterium]|nr:tetraacyldisaccharide 4'-kinase [bacterium]
MKAQTPKYFNTKLGIGILFLPLSAIYWLISNIKRLFSTPYKSKAKVLCIGNITLGGVGKTPLVIKIIETLLNKGIKVGVLSRGYGGALSSSVPVLVDGKKHSAIDVGDEVFMIYKKFKGRVPVCICTNRANGAMVLEGKVDMIIMDDGLQNYTLAKDKSVLVFDGMQTVGNGFIFPAGPLREGIKSGVKKANAIVIMRKINRLFEKKLSKYNLPIFYAKTVAKDLKKFAGKEVIAFAGIGNPQKFYDTLIGEKIKIKRSFEFPDHHTYSDEDFEKIIKSAGKLPILTTTKDYVKIPPKYQKKIIPVEIDLSIDREKQFFDIILK